MMSLREYENSIEKQEASLEDFISDCEQIILNEDLEEAYELCRELARDYNGYDFSEEVQYLDFDEVA